MPKDLAVSERSQALMEEMPRSKQAAAMELLRALEEAGAMTATSLQLADPDMPWDRYEALGFFLGRVNRSCAFWIGDWLLFGEEVFGQLAYQAAEATGLAPQTLANRASVCRHIPPNRRRAALSFGVHAEVAYHEPKERDRWLDRAELNAWTRSELREHMHAERTGLPGDVAVTSKSEELDSPHEEHRTPLPVPAQHSLGELVADPSVPTRVTVALAWIPDEHREIVIENLRPEIQSQVRELIAEDVY